LDAKVIYLALQDGAGIQFGRRDQSVIEEKRTSSAMIGVWITTTLAIRRRFQGFWKASKKREIITAFSDVHHKIAP